MARPSSACAWSHSRRSWSDRRTSAPAAIGAGRPPRRREQQQGQQAVHLGLVRHQLGEQATESDGLRAEIVARQIVARGGGVPLVEHEVDHCEHGAEPVRQLGVGRDAIRDLGVLDLALGPHEPLRHGRLGHEERSRDLARLEPAEQAEGERHLRLGSEGRVAAGEDEPQAIVAHRTDLLGLVIVLVQPDGVHLAVVAGRLAPQAVDRPVPGRGEDPAPRVGGHAGVRPALRCHDERLLDRLLGDVDVAAEADQGGDDPTALLTEDALELALVGRHAGLRPRARPGTAGPPRARGTPPRPSRPRPVRRRGQGPR